MAKAFISFLGTGNYTKCRYSFKNESGNVVKYVQEDVINRFCRDWNREDEIRIFTTDEAKKLNWDDNGHKDYKTKEIIVNTGLGKSLENMKLNASVKRYDIPVGNSEDEIWQIFQTVYDSLKENEEIIFDITHSFRSIPMLFMVLVGYARLIKNISVKAIYYGAFEVLGHPSEVEKKIPEDERVAPIFDLTSFEKLIEWTEATQSFVKNGSAAELASLANKDIGLVMRGNSYKEEKAVAEEIRYIVNGINKISQNIMVNRGAEIIKYDYGWLKDKLETVQRSDIFIKPLAPLMKVIEKKIDGFVKDDVNNGFKAVQWALEHGLYQQGITMLQENIITLILAKENLDWGLKENRSAASAAFNRTADKKKTEDNAGQENDEKDKEAFENMVKQLQQNQLVIDFAGVFESLRNISNDVNHGGFLTEIDKKSNNAQSIKDRFKKAYSEIFSKFGNL
ncbi:MAG: TIGR02221 family CRISPR-associated protein [Desulfamplus sp.]|nr:TIGR02221 family CRISPR-associated protein [Desulfamplus sp.]